MTEQNALANVEQNLPARTTVVVKIGHIPGEIKEIEVEQGTTIAEALELRFPVVEREVTSHHHHGETRTVREGGRPAGQAYVNGVEVVDEGAPVEEGDTITIVRQITGQHN